MSQCLRTGDDGYPRIDRDQISPFSTLMGYPGPQSTKPNANLTWKHPCSHQFSSVSHSCLTLLRSHEPHAAHQASLSITNSWSPPKPMSIELVMSSSHLIFFRHLLLLPSIFPSIRVFSNESCPEIMSHQLSGYPLARSRWHIKLNITEVQY